MSYVSSCYNLLCIIRSFNFSLFRELLFVWIHNVRVYQSICPYDANGEKDRYVNNPLEAFLRKLYWYTSLDTTNLILSLLNYCCYQKKNKKNIPSKWVILVGTLEPCTRKSENQKCLQNKKKSIIGTEMPES